MRLRKAPWRTVALALATSTLALGTPAAFALNDVADARIETAAEDSEQADASGSTGSAEAPSAPADQTPGDTDAPSDPQPAAVAARLNGTAYETVQAAVDAAKNGDTIVIVGSSSPNTENITVSGKALAFESDAQAPATLAGTFTLNDADGSSISGIAFVRQGQAGDTAQAAFTSLVVKDSSNVKVSGCTFTFTGGASDGTSYPSNAEARTGIRVEGDSDRVSVSNTTFHMSALTSADASTGQAYTWTGIQVMGGSQVVNDLTVSSCTLSVEAASGAATAGAEAQRYAYRLVDVTGDASAGGGQGVNGLSISAMTVANAAGLDAATSNIVGVRVTNATGVTISKATGAAATVAGQAGVRLGDTDARPNGTVTVDGLSFASNVGIELVAPTCGALTARNNTFAESVATPLKGAPAKGEHDRYYYSVSNAAAESDGDSVALTTDVTEDVTVPAGAVLDLDLAGHSITGQTGTTITNRGALSITDSGRVGSIVSPNAGHAAIVNEGTGIIAFDGGTITRAAATGTAPSNAEPLIENKGELTIGTNAAITLADASANLIENDSGSTRAPAYLLIERGTFSGGAHAVWSGRAGTVQVNNGYFRTGDAAPFAQADGAAASAYLRVYGGTYTASPIDFVPKTFVVKVNDGTYSVMLKRNLYAGEYIVAEDDSIDHSNLAEGLKATLDEETGHYKVSCNGGELCPSHAYWDVNTALWYHDPVDWAIGQGYMTGYDHTAQPTFGPDDPLSRAQVAAVFYKMAGEPDWSTDALDRYTDCDKGAWYAKAVAWATDQGIFSGYDGQALFAPDVTISREQMAVVLWRMQGEPAGTGDLSTFPDGLETDSWATSAMQWAVEAGVFMGNDQTGELMPLQGLTRAQAATVLMRIS
ncbi:S-layer homology domain-containing protein [Collinsella sp. An2]|uniref:S-layer homology domain-containing protein n=1 Tax=Collinsella sp. An2 TaxID=1965585 RepID=UPI000B365CA6|nr:S-layer homology domain-containing protein [Collinsella sp. An2]